MLDAPLICGELRIHTWFFTDFVGCVSHSSPLGSMYLPCHGRFTHHTVRSTTNRKRHKGQSGWRARLRNLGCLANMPYLHIRARAWHYRPKYLGVHTQTYLHTYAVAYCCIQPPDSRFTASWNKCVPHRSNRILHLRLLRNLHGHYASSGNAIPRCLRITVIIHCLAQQYLSSAGSTAEKEGHKNPLRTTTATQHTVCYIL